MGSYDQNSLPFPILHTIKSDLEYFQRLGSVNGVISQCEPGNWGSYGLNYYVFARMSWNSKSDLGHVVDDYCEKYYGSANEPMKRYFSKLEDAMAAMEHFRYIEPPRSILELLNQELLEDLRSEIRKAKDLTDDAMNFDRIRKTELSLTHANYLWQTLDHYTRAVKLREDGNTAEAREYFQKSVETGEKLVKFLFQNIDEGVFIASREYIFDYLEPLIIDARDQRESLKAE